jgi:hypothetical protein
MSKFGIQTLKRFEPKRAYPHDVAPRCATSSPPPYTRACTPMQAYDRSTEAVCRGHCAPKVGDALLTPRPVPRGRRAHAKPRAAFLHWLPAHPTSPTASAPMPSLLWA